MPEELPSFLDTHLVGSVHIGLPSGTVVKLLEVITDSFIHSVFLKYLALFLKGEDTAMNKAGAKIPALMAFIRFMLEERQ